MKKVTFILTITISIIVLIVFIGYRAFPEMHAASQVKVLNTGQNTYDPQNNAYTKPQETANVQEWEIFKGESELKIKDQEIQINELKTRMNEQAEKFDALHKKKIANLEQQIKYMKARLENYEKGPSNWESFKPQFSNEIDAIGNVLKDLAVDNKNQEYTK